MKDLPLQNKPTGLRPSFIKDHNWKAVNFNSGQHADDVTEVGHGIPTECIAFANGVADRSRRRLTSND